MLAARRIDVLAPAIAIDVQRARARAGANADAALVQLVEDRERRDRTTLADKAPHAFALRDAAGFDDFG